MQAVQTAVPKSCRGDVQNYAIMLQHDHMMNDADVISLAGARHIAVDHVTVTADEQNAILKMRNTSAALKAMKGCEFDSAFLQAMIDAHLFAIGVVTEAQVSATEPEIQDFLKTTLPSLQQHLQMARDLLGTGGSN